ncbi:hypothetical protein [Moraxella marmotae]|uniref:hypothetical protein n=1 Tax=Moraxella marmotae TaxID=3344520 RepID=UPI0035F2D935
MPKLRLNKNLLYLVLMLGLASCDLSSHESFEYSDEESYSEEYDDEKETETEESDTGEYSEPSSILEDLENQTNDLMADEQSEYINDYSYTTPTYDSADYHTDNAFKYEYRVGASGNYLYNYDVSGNDDNGNTVTGNVDMQGKYGSGQILDSDNNLIDVEVEWVDYGVIEAVDDDGNTYELNVE